MITLIIDVLKSLTHGAEPCLRRFTPAFTRALHWPLS
jgi:hypothetical protein